MSEKYHFTHKPYCTVQVGVMNSAALTLVCTGMSLHISSDMPSLLSGYLCSWTDSSPYVLGRRRDSEVPSKDTTFLISWILQGQPPDWEQLYSQPRNQLTVRGEINIADPQTNILLANEHTEDLCPVSETAAAGMSSFRLMCHVVSGAPYFLFTIILALKYRDNRRGERQQKVGHLLFA